MALTDNRYASYFTNGLGSGVTLRPPRCDSPACRWVFEFVSAPRGIAAAAAAAYIPQQARKGERERGGERQRSRLLAIKAISPSGHRRSETDHGWSWHRPTVRGTFLFDSVFIAPPQAMPDSALSLWVRPFCHFGHAHSEVLESAFTPPSKVIASVHISSHFLAF